MELPDRSQARSWEGQDVVDRDGQRLGRCVGVFADTATGLPEWLHVDVEGHVRSFVPALEAAEHDGTVQVRFVREAVLGAPAVGDDEQLSKAEEMELYRHYGIPVEGGEGSVLPAGDASADTSVAVTDEGAGNPALSDADEVPGAAVTPETGEDLPVLEPAAASTPVPEQQVTYVDEPERFTDAGADAARDAADAPAAAPPPAEEPRPTLRRVPPASPAPVSSTPSSAGGSDLSALTPLGAVAGVAAAVGLVLQARERRQRRRNSAAARAGRLGDSLRAGSAVARASAGSTLAGVSEAAELTRRSAVTATEKAARAAARQQEKAAAASRRQRAQTSTALAAASKTAAQQKKAAARKAASQRKAAQASLAAASKTAAQQKKAAARKAASQRKAAQASLAAASKTAAAQRKAAAASLTAASSRGSSTGTSLVAVPRRAAKRGRKVRRSLVRKLWNTVVLGAAGGGYVLGAKAGRQRYDELTQVAAAVAESPRVQSATEAVTDPERRADLLMEVQQQAGSLLGRRGEARH